MLPLLPRLLPAVVLATGPSAAPPHTWIADLKANRAAFAAAEIRLEGDVVELRSTSPGVQRGMYRLVDASGTVYVMAKARNVSDTTVVSGPTLTPINATTMDVSWTTQGLCDSWVDIGATSLVMRRRHTTVAVVWWPTV